MNKDIRDQLDLSVNQDLKDQSDPLDRKDLKENVGLLVKVVKTEILENVDHLDLEYVIHDALF